MNNNSISEIDDELFIDFFKKMFFSRNDRYGRSIDIFLENLLCKIVEEKFPIDLSQMNLQYFKLLIEIFEKVNAKKGYIRFYKGFEVRIHNLKDMVGLDVFHKIALANKKVEVNVSHEQKKSFCLDSKRMFRIFIQNSFEAFKRKF
jgi:hypothetical protein